jgi:hypothetical protein
MIHKEEEYTDYSCSTSIERLSRDVETILRAWHVDRGSDRHVSIASNTTNKSKDYDDPTSSLIRSNPISWNVSVTTAQGGRVSLILDLELALWDAPDAVILGDNEHDGPSSSSPELVRSLQRTPFSKMPSHDFLFDNFSSLFGIGQHISLTPVCPEPIQPALCEFLAQSILHRHDNDKTANSVMGATLSGWLQTALNCAISNCQSCLPAFGVWGLYRPNELIPTHPSTAAASPKSAVAASPKSFISSPSSGNSDSLFSGTTNHSMSPTTSVSNSIRATGLRVFPKWATAVRAIPMPQVSRKHRARNASNWNSHFVPPLVAGSVICPSSLESPSTSATFWCSASAPAASKEHSISTNSRLAVWGGVLLQHCPDSTVVLSGARHAFGWFKNRRPARSSLFSTKRDNAYLAAVQEWRHSPEKEIPKVFDFTRMTSQKELESYRQTCRMIAMELLSEAWGRTSYSATPLWGPLDDPVASVYATATWNGKSNDDGVVEPLLNFPLRIRSRKELSQRDWIDMEESVERTILDPLSPSAFCIQAYYDRETSVATLAANQRCTLAALIRTATLPGETFLQHLTDEDLVDLWDDNAGTIVASKLAVRAGVGALTRQIVQAMDWSIIMDDMISVREAEAIVHSVMSGMLTMHFPTSPEELSFSQDLFSPFRKSAPWGRLVSILFAHMAKLRSVSSMALVWGIFVQELRRRWEARESIPNMRYISGLDPHPLVLYEKRCFSTIGLQANFASFLHCSEPDPDDFHCLIGQKLQIFNLGVELIVAGEIAEHEAMERFLGAGEIPSSAPNDDTENDEMEIQRGPNAEEGDFDPSTRSTSSRNEDDQAHQTLQIEQSKQKWPDAKDAENVSNDAGNKSNYGPPAIDTDLEFWVMDEPGHAPNLNVGLDFVAPPTGDEGFDFVGPPPANLDKYVSNSKPFEASKQPKKQKPENKFILDNLPNALAWEGTIMNGGGSQGSDATSCSQSQAYYDAAEAGSIFSMKHGFVSMDTIVDMEDMQKRPGARCPVHGVNVHNGDQLYAPYLQRPHPLADDVVLERKLLLSRDRNGEGRIKVQCRLELAQRLQKPKLLSDMRAFKAANPKANFQDFVKWYGNPGNPLDDYNDAPVEGLSPEQASSESAAMKLDRASEAMKVLTSTRDFWAACWEEAKPAPASEQLPLFDITSTVEVALDYLEQMHPANLLNQVMAVNLSASYFTLAASAENALKIGIVENSLSKLRTKIDNALSLLSRDAAGGSTALYNDNEFGGMPSSQRYASDESISSCEEACLALSEVETMISRAVSLLNKFPEQYDLIQSLLCMADGTTVALDDHKGRSSFLNAIHKQQKEHSTFTTFESLPVPVLREYVLRNLDESNPCQLSVRFGDQGAYLDRVDNEGGVLLALSKSYKD